MRFFLKVFLLVGLIVIGKLAKQNSTETNTQAANMTLPVYYQNNANIESARHTGLGNDLQQVSYYFSY